jgi:glutaredoxin-related protein
MDKIKEDVYSYFMEYYNLDQFFEGVKAKRATFATLLNENDIVLVVKVGCGFCAKSEAKVEEYSRLLESKNEKPFSYKKVVGTSSLARKALGLALNVSEVTFPAVFVRGWYVGGSDNIRELVDTGRIATLLQGERVMDDGHNYIAWDKPLAEDARTPKVIFAPQPGLPMNKYIVMIAPFFHWHMYGNLVRYISLFHMIIMGIMIGLFSMGPELGSTVMQAAKVLMIIFFIDLAALVVVGPYPISPSGLLSALVMWKYKGNIVSALPYKYIWITYLVALIPVYITLETKSDNQLVLIELISFIVNSASLAVFRF